MKRTILLSGIGCSLLLLAVVIQPLCFVIGAIYFVWTHPVPPAAAAVESAAREQVDAALPIGSTIEEVETWINSQISYHVKGVDEEDCPYIHSEQTVYRGFWYNLELQIDFNFNKDGRLSKKWLRVVSVSL